MIFFPVQTQLRVPPPIFAVSANRWKFEMMQASIHLTAFGLKRSNIFAVEWGEKLIELGSFAGLLYPNLVALG